MDQLKALEVLKKTHTDLKYGYMDSDDCVRSEFVIEAIAELVALEYSHEALKERIAVLLALQDPKCDGCIHWTLGGGCSGNFMIKCSRFPHLVDRYEPKS